MGSPCEARSEIPEDWGAARSDNVEGILYQGTERRRLPTGHRERYCHLPEDLSLEPMKTRIADAYGRPLRDLRISVTDRCNLRCPYCMPAEVFSQSFRFLPKPEILTFDEILRLARIFVDLGVTKIRITGGEPLLRTDLPDLIRDLAALPDVQDLTLTTNGLLLGRDAHALRHAGLHRLTVSLDSLDPAVYRALAGRDADPQTVLIGIQAAEAAGFDSIKINCVVKRGVNDHTILDLVEHFRNTNHVLRFIEYMDVGSMNGWQLAHVVSGEEILSLIASRYEWEAIPSQYPGEVAKRYRLKDGSLEVGLITSVSQPFCGDCTRARLSTKGDFVTCLFASGGIDLREPLRSGASDETLRDHIMKCWTVRSDRYSELRTEATAGERTRIEMFRLGG